MDHGDKLSLGMVTDLGPKCENNINLEMGSDNLSPSVVTKPDYSSWIAENHPGSASSMEPGDNLSPSPVTDLEPGNGQ